MIVLRRHLADRRRAFAWWSVGVLVAVALTLALWPSVRGEDQIEDLVRDLPEAVRALVGAQEGVSFTSAPGYLHSRLFSTLLPVLMLVFAIGLGARAVGGAEEDGTLELLLARPVTRGAVSTQRLVAVVALVVGLGGVGMAAVLVLGWLVELFDGVAPGRVFLAGLALVALALLHAAVAFAVGCISGRRGPAVAVGGTLAAGGYLLHGLGAVAPAARPAALLSPWHWYLQRNLLVSPVAVPAVVLPLLVGAAAAAAGLWWFARRDLRLP